MQLEDEEVEMKKMMMISQNFVMDIGHPTTMKYNCKDLHTVENKQFFGHPNFTLN